MTPLGMLGVGIMIVGGLIMVIFSIIYYIKAFKHSILIGIVNIFFGIAYLMIDPKKAWKPFVLAWVGCFILLGGTFLAEVQNVF